MLFNSIAFFVFLPLVFVLYWGILKRPLRLQNGLVLVASYVFYAWWDWRFLGLIMISTLVDFVIAQGLATQDRPTGRKFLLYISLFVNLGLLCFFKYFNFFIESWVDAWQLFGVTISVNTLHIILPVGISFYTFQTLSYTIDVYHRKLEPSRDFVAFAAYVSFFPQLVAGPIERASHLLPQFMQKRCFDFAFAKSGFYLIIWGLFKKVVIADQCGFYVNQIFDHSGSHGSLTLFVGAVLFGFQIYGDFSGYSDIAIGVGRLFGISLMTNFSFPYFSRNIAEFWRRWHISLTTWFRDYVYIPLGGSRGPRWFVIRNISIVFLVSGFWHGANWTFIVWGAIHALLFLPLLIIKAHRKHLNTTQFSLVQLPQLFFTFILVTLAWVFFRADTISIACTYIFDIFKLEGGSLAFFYKTPKYALFSLIIGVGIFVLLFFEYFAVQKNQKEVVLNRYSAIFIALLIVFMGVFKNPSDFIYFQF